MRLNTLFRVLALLALALSGGHFTPPAAAAAWQNKVDPWVMQTAAAGESEFLVALVEQADLSPAARLTSKTEKGRFVVAALQETAQRSQAPLLRWLEAQGATYKAYWVANLVWVRGDAALVQALASRPEVAHLYANPRVQLNLPPEEQPAAPLAPDAPDAIEWNILKINADDVWGAGYNGQGVVIGGQDTGYVWSHPALKAQYRGWDGSAANHNYNWHDATGGSPLTPVDPQGHGTHTMGIMVGDDGGTNQVGVAPGARWIGCRNMDANGYGTPATYTECYQWFIAPTDLSGANANSDLAPDVINNSWGCTPGEGCATDNPDILKGIVENVRAAGILTAHSAGNYGSVCSTIREPAAIYEASFTVGSTTSTDAISSFSSRGPVTIDGSNRLKPNVSAPGSSIRSSLKDGSYGTMSGTSMAAPHVAGLAALLISANPELGGQVDLLEELIEQSAVRLVDTYADKCGLEVGEIPNVTFGWGRVDAWAAHELQPRLELGGAVSHSQAAPGQVITYTFTITNPHTLVTQETVSLVDALPANTTFASATGAYTLLNGQVSWDLDSLTPGEVNTVQLVVAINPGTSGSITNQNYTADGSLATPVSGAPLVTEIPSLQLHKHAPAAVAPGQMLTYTLTLTNASTSQVQTNLVLTDTIPAGTTFITATPPHQQTGSTVRWDFASLAASTSTSVELVVQVSPTATGSVINQDYTAHSDQVSPLAGQPVESEIIPFVLELNKLAPAQVLPGGTITYTLQITNPHPFAMQSGVSLTDTLPAHTTFIATMPGAVQQGDLFTWEVGELAAGEAWQAQLVVQAEPDFAGVILNADYGAASDQAASATPAPVKTEVHILAVSKDGPASVLPGELFTYTLTVTNLNPDQSVTNLVLSDTLPAGTTFVSASDNAMFVNGVVTWEKASLDPGASWQAELVVRALFSDLEQINNSDYAARCEEIDIPATGEPVLTRLQRILYLPLLLR